MRNQREINKIFDFKGPLEKHTAAHLAENRNRIIQRTAAAASSSAFHGDHDEADEPTNLAWDELGIVGSECANHRCITACQRAKGRTAIEEQSSGRVNSAEYISRLHALGTLVYAFIPIDMLCHLLQEPPLK